MRCFSAYRHLFVFTAIACLVIAGYNQPGATGPKVLGEITAIVNGDGSTTPSPIQWNVNGVVHRDNIRSRSQWQGDSNHGSVVLLGQLPGLGTDKTIGSVGFRFDVDQTTRDQPDAKIRYYVDGLDRPSFASKDGGSANITLDSIQFGEQTVQLKGTFDAVLPFRRKGKSFLTNTRELTQGSFNVVVPIVGRAPTVTAEKYEGLAEAVQ